MSAIVKCLLFVQSSISGSAFSVGCQASTCTVSLIFKHWNGFVVSVLLVWIVVSFYRFTDSLLTQIWHCIWVRKWVSHWELLGALATAVLSGRSPPNFCLLWWI